MRNVNEAFTVHPRAEAPSMRYEGETLRDVYGRYSDNKKRAFDCCVSLCEEFNGYSFRITSHNSFSFCVMFDFANPETGEAMRAHITPAYNHAYYL